MNRKHPLAGFRFADLASTTSGPAVRGELLAHVVQIAAGVRRKRELLAQYAQVLQFPEYFGWNWDALEETLRDLSWLAEPRRIVVVHADVPFAPHGKNRPDYLALLRDLLADGADLAAVFPPSAQDEVAKILGE